MRNKFLIVGLGNPGEKYQNTRHNLGYRVIEELKKSLPKSLLGQVILFRPPCFVNISGLFVKNKLDELNLRPKNLILIFDDLDLPFGVVRYKEKGRSGGHKGVQSIIDTLNTTEFKRIKLGIGRPPEGKSAEEYVLEEFSPEEEEVVKLMIDKAINKLIELINE